MKTPSSVNRAATFTAENDVGEISGRKKAVQASALQSRRDLVNQRYEKELAEAKEAHKKASDEISESEREVEERVAVAQSAYNQVAAEREAARNSAEFKESENCVAIAKLAWLEVRACRNEAWAWWFEAIALSKEAESRLLEAEARSYEAHWRSARDLEAEEEQAVAEQKRAREEAARTHEVGATTEEQKQEKDLALRIEMAEARNDVADVCLREAKKGEVNARERQVKAEARLKEAKSRGEAANVVVAARWADAIEAWVDAIEAFRVHAEETWDTHHSTSKGDDERFNEAEDRFRQAERDHAALLKRLPDLEQARAQLQAAKNSFEFDGRRLIARKAAAKEAFNHASTLAKARRAAAQEALAVADHIITASVANATKHHDKALAAMRGRHEATRTTLQTALDTADAEVQRLQATATALDTAVTAMREQHEATRTTMQTALDTANAEVQRLQASATALETALAEATERKATTASAASSHPIQQHLSQSFAGIRITDTSTGTDSAKMPDESDALAVAEAAFKAGSFAISSLEAEAKQRWADAQLAYEQSVTAATKSSAELMESAGGVEDAKTQMDKATAFYEDAAAYWLEATARRAEAAARRDEAEARRYESEWRSFQAREEEDASAVRERSDALSEEIQAGNWAARVCGERDDSVESKTGFLEESLPARREQVHTRWLAAIARNGDAYWREKHAQARVAQAKARSVHTAPIDATWRESFTLSLEETRIHTSTTLQREAYQIMGPARERVLERTTAWEAAQSAHAAVLARVPVLDEARERLQAAKDRYEADCLEIASRNAAENKLRHHDTRTMSVVRRAQLVSECWMAEVAAAEQALQEADEKTAARERAVEERWVDAQRAYQEAAANEEESVCSSSEALASERRVALAERASQRLHVDCEATHASYLKAEARHCEATARWYEAQARRTEAVARGFQIPVEELEQEAAMARREEAEAQAAESEDDDDEEEEEDEEESVEVGTAADDDHMDGCSCEALTKASKRVEKAEALLEKAEARQAKAEERVAEANALLKKVTTSSPSSELASSVDPTVVQKVGELLATRVLEAEACHDEAHSRSAEALTERGEASSRHDAADADLERAKEEHAALLDRMSNLEEPRAQLQAAEASFEKERALITSRKVADRALRDELVAAATTRYEAALAELEMAKRPRQAPPPNRSVPIQDTDALRVRYEDLLACLESTVDKSLAEAKQLLRRWNVR